MYTNEYIVFELEDGTLELWAVDPHTLEVYYV